MSKRIFFVFGLVFAGLVFAHHGAAQYELDKTVTLQGVVKEFIWTSPHVVLMVLAESKPGEQQEWRLELTGPGRLTLAGYNKRTVKPGDKITFDFSPMRDGSRVGWLKKVRNAEGVVVLDFSLQGGPGQPNSP